MLHVVPYYGAALGLLFVALSVRVIGGRRAARVAVGDGGDAALQRRIRVQGNFAEYAPFALVLLALAELNGTPPIALHGLGVCLLLGRLAHAWGMSCTPEDFRFRTAGMAATFTAILLSSVALVL